MSYIDDEAPAFLGAGWAMAMHTEPTGAVALALYEEDVREAIRIILATDLGERLMRPDFGAGLGQLVFEPINTTTMALAQHHVERALVLWEPRIDHVKVDVSAEPVLGRLLIDIAYRVRATNTFYNLVYPFYLIEARDR